MSDTQSLTPPYKRDDASAKKYPSGLAVQIVHQSADTTHPKPGDTVVVHYHGLLANDTVFDSSVKRNEPFEFVLGVGQVISGWDEGIAYLTPGTKAILTVPPDLGYGPDGSGPIPPNATLYFHVELMKIKQGRKRFDVSAIQPTTDTYGMEYRTLESGTGNVPNKGQTIKLHFHGQVKNGRFIGSSFGGSPLTLKAGDTAGFAIPGLPLAALNFKKGQKLVLEMPPAMGFGSQPRPGIPPNSPLSFDLEVLDIVEPFNPYPYSMSAMKTTASGLKYQIIEEGKGAKPLPGQTVSVNYHGMLENGKVFDSSFERGEEPIEFPLGQGRVIKGWDEGIGLLNVGTKAVLFIPANLGYGQRGAGKDIPPNANLIFHVRLEAIQ
jgi:peptidylprolyl isomerase